MAQVSIEGAKKEITFLVPPEAVTIVNDEASVLFDERADQPLDQALVDSIVKNGVMVPTIVRKNGDVWELVDGRQRHRAITEANKILKKSKQDTHLLPCRTFKGDDLALMEVMISTNALRVDDEPSKQAVKMQRAIEFGATEEDLARLWGVNKQTIKNRLIILDCTKKVQQAVDQQRIPETAVRELAKIDRKEQNGVLDDLIKKDLVRGAALKRALAAAVTGKKPKPKTQVEAQRMRSKQYVVGMYEAIEHVSGGKITKDQATARAVLSYILGDKEALDNIPSVKKVVEVLKADGSIREEGTEEAEAEE